MSIADGVDDDLSQIDRGEVEGAASIEPCSEQQVVDEMRHASGLGFDPAQRMDDRGWHGLTLATGQLGIPAD